MSLAAAQSLNGAWWLLGTRKCPRKKVSKYISKVGADWLWLEGNRKGRKKEEIKI
jgi:hypothetical protein